MIMKSKWRKVDVLNIVIGLLTAFRVVLSGWLGQWLYSLSTHDDALLIRYADFTYHYLEQGMPPQQALVKECMYPLFLNIVHISGLSYTTILALCWVIAALLVVRAFRVVTDNRWYLSFVYLFVLFTPCAFESWLGTRVYRNAIMAPFVFIVFAMFIYMFLIYIKGEELSMRRCICNWIMLGIVTYFTAYIKEDGIWLLACLCAVVLACALAVFIRKRQCKWLMLVVIPLFVFFGLLNLNKAVNYHYFGIYETNTRTSGELSDFVNNIYKIDAEGRTQSIWAPYDAIAQAYEASETFNSHPELFDHIVNTGWQENSIIETPLVGDFLTWILRDAIVDSGLWSSEAEVADLFKQINDELDQAFLDGRLKEDSKFRLLPSTGGRTKEELANFRYYMSDLYLTVFHLDGYEVGGVMSEEFEAEVTGLAIEYCNANLAPLIGVGNEMAVVRVTKANRVVHAIFMLYKCLHPIVCLLTLAGCICFLFYGIQKLRKKERIDTLSFWLFILLIGLVALSLVYAFCICWFTTFIMSQRWLSYYSSALIVMVELIELIGVYLFATGVNAIKMSKKG